MNRWEWKGGQLQTKFQTLIQQGLPEPLVFCFLSLWVVAGLLSGHGCSSIVANFVFFVIIVSCNCDCYFSGPR